MKKDIIEKLESITAKKVKYYKSDFEIDKEYIKNNDYNFYVWIARESGTYLLPLKKVLELKSEAQIIYNYYLCDTNNYYFIDIKNNVVREFKKIKTIQNLKEFYNNYIKKAA